jgi:hypothetical protein
MSARVGSNSERSSNGIRLLSAAIPWSTDRQARFEALQNLVDAGSGEQNDGISITISPLSMPVGRRSLRCRLRKGILGAATAGTFARTRDALPCRLWPTRQDPIQRYLGFQCLEAVFDRGQIVACNTQRTHPGEIDRPWRFSASETPHLTPGGLLDCCSD